MGFRSRIAIRAFDQPWDALPDHVKEAFSDEERQAYIEGAHYFTSLTKQCRIPQSVQLFSELSGDHPMFVFVEAEGNGTTYIWFAFTFVDNSICRPLFRLRKPFPLPESAPDEVRYVYDLWGGIRSDDEATDGILPPEKIWSVRTSPSIQGRDASLAGLENGACVHVFLSYGNGEYLGWTESGECALVRQGGALVRRIELHECLDAFWNCLIEKVDTNQLFGNLPE